MEPKDGFEFCINMYFKACVFFILKGSIKQSVFLLIVDRSVTLINCIIVSQLCFAYSPICQYGYMKENMMEKRQNTVMVFKIANLYRRERDHHRRKWLKLFFSWYPLSVMPAVPRWKLLQRSSFPSLSLFLQLLQIQIILAQLSDWGEDEDKKQKCEKRKCFKDLIFSFFNILFCVCVYYYFIF